MSNETAFLRTTVYMQGTPTEKDFIGYASGTAFVVGRNTDNQRIIVKESV